MSTLNVEAATARPDVQTPRTTVALAFGRTDALNLALLFGVFVLVLLVVPPVRSFPINDDWAYAHPIDGLLRLQYERHPWAQAWALTHEAWGGLFSLVFGSGYTSLSIANLAMSALCVAVLYVLLRQLNVGSLVAALGAALLLFHPVFFNLSYSFMTDITFLCMVLLACLLFVRAVQTGSDGLLWAGSVAAALATVTRQFGVVIVAVMLAYLWWRGGLTWRRALAVTAIPVLAGAAYLVWESGQPAPLIDYYMRQDASARVSQFFLSLAPRLIMTSRVLSVCSLFLIPLVYRTRSRRWTLLLGVLMVFCLVPLVVMFGTVYPYLGNVIDNTGFGFCCGTTLPIWSEAVWAGLAVVGAFSAAFLLVAAAERFRPSELREPRGERNTDPVFIVYLVCLVLSAIIFVFPVAVADRYMLPTVAALIVFGCRQLERVGVAGTRGMALRWALVVPVVLFSVAAQHDFMQNRATRWAAAEDLVSGGIARDHVDAGYEWGGEFIFDPGAERMREAGNITRIEWPPYSLITPEYAIDEYHRSGYDVVGEYHFTTWLEPGRTRTVLVQERQ